MPTFTKETPFLSDIQNITFADQTEATLFFEEQTRFGKPYKFIYTLNTDPSKVYYIDEIIGVAVLLGSGGGGAVLFPNGFEDVLVSRDFLHTDIGKALRLANDDVVLTMPEGVFWTEEEKGQIIVVIADAVNVGYDKTFEVPVLMQGRDEDNSLVGEYSLLVTGETGGQSNVATISSTILKDGDYWKTAIRYLYDKTGMLFPNGVNVITADYELQSSDEGKFIIAIGDNIAITIPTGIIFQGGYALGISMHGTNCTFQIDQLRGNISFIEQVDDGLGSGEPGGENILFLTIPDDGDGNSILVPLSTSLISDGGTQKTMLRYLYDHKGEIVTQRLTEAMTIIAVGSPTDNFVGGAALVISDTATRPTITTGAFADDFSFLTGYEVVNFNTINTQIAQIGMFDQVSGNDLDDTKLFFVNTNGVKQTFLIGMPDDTAVEGEDIVILNPTTKQIKTINKTQLLGTSAHTIFTPLTGDTIALISKNYNIVNPAGTIAALTVDLPSSPNNNDTVIIKFTQIVTTVTYGNGTVLGGLISPIAGSQVTLVYDTATNTWY